MNAPFVTSLRTRGEGVDLSGGSADAFVIRAQVHEAWDAVKVRVTPATRILDVKTAGMHALLGESVDVAQYVVKVHAHEVVDESRSLEQAMVRAGTTVFMHTRRRRPIRS